MDYTAGFYISDKAATEKFGYHSVALIRKKRPAWQAGRLNAIGGKLERGELPIDCQVREFREETGVVTKPEDWEKFATLRLPESSGTDNVVHFFCAYGDPSKCETLTDEDIQVLPTSLVKSGLSPLHVISNLQWLLPLAMDTKICPVTISYLPQQAGK